MPEAKVLGNYNVSRVRVVCPQCYRIFEIYRCAIKKEKENFCSRYCKAKAQFVPVFDKYNPSFKHGKHWSRKRRLAKEALLKRGVALDVCERCNTKIEDTKAVQFHHINRDPWDNRPNNIEVLCVSCHGKEHYNEREINELGQFI